MRVGDLNMTLASSRMGNDFENGWSSWKADFELSCKAMPIENILEVIQFLPYAHPLRVYIQFLFLTGARPSEACKSEIDGKDSFIKGNYFFWRCGKNQKGMWRKEFLPDFFLKELDEYKRKTKAVYGKIFHTQPKTLSKYFNVQIRPYLSKSWQERAVVPHGLALEHVLQIKGLRKSFATLCFWGYWDEYDDSSVAMHLTCKRMRHSTTGMTVSHYIEQGERMNRKKWKGWTPSQILTLATQRSLVDFKPDKFSKKLLEENIQKRIIEY